MNITMRGRRIATALVLALLVGACSLPALPFIAQPTPATSPTPIPLPTPADRTEPLGTEKNPVVFALQPTIQPSPDAIAAANALVARLQSTTGYRIVAVVPQTERDLVDGFGKGNAHIAVLSPFAYLVAHQAGNADAAFVRTVNGNGFYGTQFLARADSNFTSYYDAATASTTADAPAALSQLDGRKPCWTDQLSPSGYAIPLGYLAQAKAIPGTAAVLAGQGAVVRAVYAGGICDFGATYVDAREYPGIADALPDLSTRVSVIWRSPAIIPYDSMVFAHRMPEDMRRAFLRAFADEVASPKGRKAMQTLYSFDAMRIVLDNEYDAFAAVAAQSGLDPNSLIR